MPDTEAPQHEQNWFDHLLKKIMPNGTVMRRFIAGAYVSLAVAAVLGTISLNKTDGNASRGAAAICAIIHYGEATLLQSPAVNASDSATQRFRKLVRDLRDTGVRCNPLPPVLNP